MKGYIRVVLLTVVFLLQCFLVEGQTFKTAQLSHAADILGIRNDIAYLQPGETKELNSNRGHVVIVRLDKLKQVEHIGIPLFDLRMRSLIPSPVYDFLEFAVLNWKYKINPNDLYLAKVLFRKGKWDTLFNSRLDCCECTISNEDDKLYVVTWSKDGQEVAVVGVPIEYELLANDRRRNMERLFVKELTNYQPPIQNKNEGNISEEDLKIYGTEGLFVLEGQAHLIPNLNQNVYYRLQTIIEKHDTIIRGKHETEQLEAVIPCIVVDNEHPAETFANLMMSSDDNIPEVIINLDVHMSDYHRKQLSLPFYMLKEFLISQGCQMFFANSSSSEEVQRAILFVHNPTRGYNHLLSMKIPTEQLTVKHPQVEAAVYLYIPSISKDRLFGKTPKKKSGQKIYGD